MKKLLSFCLAISIIFHLSPINILALETEGQLIQETDKVQREIDALFTELNEMAAEEKMAELLVKENRETEEKVAAIKEQNLLRKQDLENHLEALGVNTIDPDDPDDIASLSEVMLGNNNPSTLSILDPPKFGSFCQLLLFAAIHR